MRKKIVRLEDLPEGTTKRFSFQRDGMRVDAFVANFKGDIVAYENLCRHLPITLDYGDGEFSAATAACSSARHTVHSTNPKPVCASTAPAPVPA